MTFRQQKHTVNFREKNIFCQNIVNSVLYIAIICVFHLRSQPRVFIGENLHTSAKKIQVY